MSVNGVEMHSCFKGGNTLEAIVTPTIPDGVKQIGRGSI